MKRQHDVIAEMTPGEIGYVHRNNILTKHMLDRIGRMEAYIQEELMTSNYVAGFLVDKGHVNGPEYHLITDTGIIKIYNAESLKMITLKGARGGQIKQYYKGKKIPQEVKKVVDLCYERQNGANPIHEL